MHDSRTAANSFLALVGRASAALTPMQLLKPVYIANGWTRGLHRRPLIRNEIQAWQYGLVIPCL
jgi:uncharacterized phage-associated protein